MRQRAIGAAGVLSLGLALAAPAAAPARKITVTLFGGATVTIEVPDGTPLDHLVLPPVDTPLVGVHDGGPAATAQAPPAAARPGAHHRRHHRAKRRRAVARPVKTRVAAPRRHRHRAAVAVTHPPTSANPTFSYAIPGAAVIGVPDFFIDKFRIPPFLLPIYQAAGIQYGVRWEVLAAINEIESDYGRNLNVSSAGAVGWMQFMPATWKRYGVDANGDHRRDPYNPVDAIFGAARYLKAAGAATDIRRAVFAYNHAGWYVDSVLLRARLIGGMPAELVGSLTGLAEGRFPVAAVSRYVRGSSRGLNIYARPGAAAIAATDAKVVKRGHRRALGRFIQIRDVYGNTYTYGNLKKVSRSARVGKRVAAGRVLGRIGTTSTAPAHLHFAIRPVGRHAPLIDPKPILDGWKLLESTAIYRLRGKNPLVATGAASIGQVLLMTKDQLAERVLADKTIEIYPAGRGDIRAGRIDRRVLATLAFLSASGLKPTVSCLQSGHSLLTSSGNISEHASGNAVDISAINGIPILGHQGAGSITETTIRALLTLQGTVKPHQIISLMTFEGADNTLALPDHADHIHVGFHPDVTTVLEPLQWTKLVDRLAEIPNPTIPSAGDER